MTTLKAAREWRELNASKKPRHNSSREEPELEPEETDAPAKPRAIKRRESTGDSLTDAYYRAIDAFEEIGKLLLDAMEAGNVAKISALLSIHNKCLQAQFDAEKFYREELERRKVLIQLSDAKAMAMASLSTMVRRLDAMPQKMASQCNKEFPLKALEALTRESRDIKEDVAKAFVLKDIESK